MAWTVTGRGPNFMAVFSCADAAQAAGAVRFLEGGDYGAITVSDDDGRAVPLADLTADSAPAPATAENPPARPSRAVA